MRTMDAHVTGFAYTTCHVYATKVTVDDHTWTLHLRYTAFHRFYERLVTLEKHFPVAFPPKGGVFSSPSPAARQAQLNDFLGGTLAYFDLRGHPKRMGALLDELLQVSDHVKGTVHKATDDEDRTASEGSSDEHDDYLENSSSGDNNEESRAPEPFAADVEVGRQVASEVSLVGALSATGPGASTGTTAGLASGVSPGAGRGQARDTAVPSAAGGNEEAADQAVERELADRGELDERPETWEAPVVKWFRRLSTFSSGEVGEQGDKAEAKKRQAEDEEEARAAARARAEEDAARDEAEETAAMAREDAEEKARVAARKAALVRIEEEREVRLQRYRQPVFFQSLRCDVGTSRYSYP
ncbi:unnamed protein product [Hyaloperonospora brassicae]|uniref:PX domain-containing protein n=1 Tax=Hyaloperonospora brassicae TaxID=162125 RepID=A0AAV0SZK9_HYABA|nr:unnamed protein product [Hyaloperonospora brassicae]